MQTYKNLPEDAREWFASWLGAALKEPLKLMGKNKCELGVVISKALRLLQNEDVPESYTVLEAADELMNGLIDQTASGFESGSKQNYMNGLQEMLRVVRAKGTCLENPHLVVCRLLNMIIGDSVKGLESYIKALLAEVAAKIVAKLLANNKEK